MDLHGAERVVAGMSVTACNARCVSTLSMCAHVAKDTPGNRSNTTCSTHTHTQRTSDRASAQASERARQG
eukprot:14356744-Alexandrium_andersonii.AAC.1